MVTSFHKFSIKEPPPPGTTVWYAGAVAIYKGN
jgi:hypothetical protein